MSQSLIVCCDGTWDRPKEASGGVPTCTNVLKLHNGLASTAKSGERQQALYHDGVGADGGKLEHWLGGLFGKGLAQNVRDCYQFLATHFTPGDRIYLFGFSRGAYTARSLAGMVRNCGILRPGQLDLIDEAFKLYRDRGDDSAPSGARARAFRSGHAWHDETPIHVVGVWDTVGSLGFPSPIPLVHRWWGFHDSDLSRIVSNAFHGIAIDERRRPFQPTIWTRQNAPPNQVLEQVWFSGVHRGVGGGYADPDLADIALHWMVRRAAACDIAFKDGYFAVDWEAPDVSSRCRGETIRPSWDGPWNESRTGLWKLMAPRWRSIPYGPPERRDLTNQSVSNTAKERLEEGVSISPQLNAYLDGTPVVTQVFPNPVPR